MEDQNIWLVNRMLEVFKSSCMVVHKSDYTDGQVELYREHLSELNFLMERYDSLKKKKSEKKLQDTISISMSMNYGRSGDNEKGDQNVHKQ